MFDSDQCRILAAAETNQLIFGASELQTDRENDDVTSGVFLFDMNVSP